MSSFQFKNSEFSCSQRSFESPSLHGSLSQVLSLRVKGKVISSTLKKKVFAKFLQKSPDSNFEPGEKRKDNWEGTEKRIETGKLTQNSRKEGPARHRGSVIMKLDLINRLENQSATSENKSYSNLNLEAIKSFNVNTRSRTRSSMVFEKINNTSDRLSLKRSKVVNKFYHDFVADLKEKTEMRPITNRTDSEQKKYRSLSSRLSISKVPETLMKKEVILNPKTTSPKLKQVTLNVGFNICEEMKSITSNHFFQKLKGKKQMEMKKSPTKTKNAKSNIFYENLMLSHIFETKLSAEERERFSKFLLNDWVNKMIFERKIEESEINNEFLSNREELEKIRKSIDDNKTIRDQFETNNKNINKNELFNPPNILNRFRESVYLNQATQLRKTFKLSNLQEYLSSKHYSERDQFYKVSQAAIRSIKTLKMKRKKIRNHSIGKERMWELRDSIMEHCRMIKELGSTVGEEFLMNGLQRRPFESSGSYVFLSFVKKGKIAYVETMLEKNPKLAFDFDLIWKTGLHIACENEFPDIVQVLVKHHSRVNVRDIVGRTPLYFAAKNNDHTSVSNLFRKWARPWSTAKCNYNELDTNHIIKELFKKAKMMDLIRKITPKRLINKEWENALLNSFFK